MSKEMLSMSEVAQMLGLGMRTVIRMRDGGKLPAPLIMGARTIRFRETHIREWLDAGCPDCRRTGWRPRGKAVR